METKVSTSAGAQAALAAGAYERVNVMGGELLESIGHLYYCRSLLGSPPPKPDTLRAELGQWAFRIVRRALFWLWPQLDQFCAASIEVAEGHVAALQALSERLARVEAAVASFATQESAASPDPATTSMDAMPKRGFPWMHEIERLRVHLEQHHLRTETALWVESVQSRAAVEALENRLRAGGAPKDPQL